MRISILFLSFNLYILAAISISTRTCMYYTNIMFIWLKFIWIWYRFIITFKCTMKGNLKWQNFDLLECLNLPYSKCSHLLGVDVFDYTFALIIFMPDSATKFNGGQLVYNKFTLDLVFPEKLRKYFFIRIRIKNKMW